MEEIFSQNPPRVSKPMSLIYDCSPFVLLTMSNEVYFPRSRQIDKLPGVLKRPKEMQVLCVGLSRTATLSKLLSWLRPSMIYLEDSLTLPIMARKS